VGGGNTDVLMIRTYTFAFHQIEHHCFEGDVLGRWCIPLIIRLLEARVTMLTGNELTSSRWQQGLYEHAPGADSETNVA
jgi:hypothetical protein